MVVESDNPGTAATHTVQSTFEIKPSVISLVVPQAFGLLPQGPGVAAGPVPAVAHPPVAVAAPVGQAAAIQVNPFAVAVPARGKRIEPDELMIRWNDLPRDSRVFLYLPDVDNRTIVAAAAARNGPPILKAHDSETLLCRVGDVCYIPVPGPRVLNIPGLISIELPPTVSRGQQFTVTIHQISGLPRRIIGSFQITLAVRSAAEMLPRETRRLSVLRYIGLSIPVANRWYKIWQRLLGQVGDRVRDLGGDPDQVPPSPTGEGRPDDPYQPEPCDGNFDSATGEISRIFYDCTGRFEGFVLKTCSGEHIFKACEQGIEEIVFKACRDHLQVTIWFREGKVRRSAINCC